MLQARLLKLKPFSGPKRYVFKDPDTGHEYEAKSQKDLIQLIVGYRSQNQLKAITHLDIVLQAYWCSLPENLGDCCERKILDRGLLAYIKGGIALIDNLWYGPDARVSEEEAAARGEICSKCQYNIDPDKSKFAAWADDMAELSVGKTRSKYHDQLFNCEVCTCNLRAKVWYKGDMGLSGVQKAKMRRVGCWQVKQGE